MKVTILGFELKSGKFTPEGKKKSIAFNNLHLHCSYNNDYEEGQNYGFGSSVISEKIKNEPDRIRRIFGCLVTSDDLESMVGCDYEFSYNQNGKLDKIYPLDSPAEPAAEKKGS